MNKKQINMSKKRVVYIPIGPEENLIIQPYLIIELLFNLKKHYFISSDYFSKMNYNNDTRDLLKRTDIDNLGLIMLSLYAMLVIPKEILKKTYVPDFEKINKKMSRYCQNTETNYKNKNIDFTYHLRNAVSHGRISFVNDNLIFKDQNKSGSRKFKSEINLIDLGELINDLETIIHQYIYYLIEPKS
jgi:hypothetical protein